jgi:hypothetical protein
MGIMSPFRPDGPPLTGPPAAESVKDEPCDRCGEPGSNRVAFPYFTAAGTPRLGTLVLCRLHYSWYTAALDAFTRREREA